MYTGDTVQPSHTVPQTGPYCQISTKPSSLPQGLRHPPAYTSPPLSASSAISPPEYNDDGLPNYASLNHNSHPPPEKSSDPPAQDVLHFLSHPHDTLYSLSLRYKVPISALRRTNKLTSDHLLLARRTILIPGEYYTGGMSLSPRPVEGEEEEKKKAKIRRWMMGCKVSECVF